MNATYGMEAVRTCAPMWMDPFTARVALDLKLTIGIKYQFSN